MDDTHRAGLTKAQAVGVSDELGRSASPSVAPGDRVGAGQTIARVGESEEAQLGYLYFEIRQENKPEDPQKWLR